MIYAVIALCAVGAVGIVVGLVFQRRMGAMARASTVGCVDLPQVAGADEPVTLEVVGNAGPDKTLLTAPFSGAPCVWYRTKVTHRYRERRRNNNGETEWVTKNDQVAEDISPDPISVTDISGSVQVFPQGAKVIGAHGSLDRFEHHRPGAGPPTGDSLAARALSIAGGLLNQQTSETIGYRYEEWILREGGELYVLAGARRDHGGACWLERPASGPFLISTRSEKQLTRQARTGMIIGYGIAAAALAAALVCGLLLLLG